MVNNIMPNTISQNQNFSMARNIGILLNRNLSGNEQNNSFEGFIKVNKIDTVVKHFNEKDSKIIMYKVKTKQSLIENQSSIKKEGVKENLHIYQKQLTLPRSRNNI